MKHLITGGAGFIGSHLAEKLLKSGEEVSIIDDLSTGSIVNIEHLKSKNGIHYVIDTIMNKSLMAELIDSSDIIFHLAASVGVKLIIESPIRTIETNVKGTEIVLELASKKRKKVILASSSEVYGKSNEAIFREDNDLVFGPTYKSRWSYACSKAMDEFLSLAYWREKRLPVVIVRLFNTVGPRQTGRYGMVLPTFIKQALSGEPITVYGDGEQSRSFTWVGDVVDAMIRLAPYPEAIGEIINVGNNQEITIKSLAELVKEVTRSKSEIVYIPYDKAYEEGFEDLRRRVPDISKVKELIGYEPTKNIGEMIEIMVKDLKREI
ncbi:GDP-mannose 4,6-dehydratase [Chloroflexota bacterium]